MHTTRLILAASIMLIVTGPLRAETHWIWHEQSRVTSPLVQFSRTFELKEIPQRAEWTAAAEYCAASIWVNDHELRIEPYGKPAKADAAAWLKQGENTIRINCRPVDGPSAVMARLEIHDSSGTTYLSTDSTWKLATFARVIPPIGPTKVISQGVVAGYRFGLDQPSITISPHDDYTQWKRAIDASQGTDPRTFEVAPGFEVDLIHSAREGEDSWVSLAVDPKGRWIIGQEQQGLLRLTIPEKGGAAEVERMNSTLRECRGLQYQHGSLYALANNDKALYRLRDTTGDDQFDSAEKLFEFPGDVGHGRNQLTLAPDGTLYGIFGDAVSQPDSLPSIVPQLADPTAAEKTRNGFVARFDDEIGESNVIVRGLRNPYGLAFNQHGDMFTYDADAEYDMGSSWYRPTRVLHLIPGGDYRWRRVTQQWPPYFPDQADMPQPTLDIGKGSPTAVAFGSGKQFPPKYAEALYVLDWAYGRIVAVHLTPLGSSYHAVPETFLRGQPLNVTDVEFGPDGAMYFTTGGRGTQSALYRVRYVGEPVAAEPPTRQQLARRKHAEKSRRTRNRLHDWTESPDVENFETIWQELGNDDPWIRHAARSALERLPLEAWRERALNEDNPRRQRAALIALTRVDPDPPMTAIADMLSETEFGGQRATPELELLYLAERVIGYPDPKLSTRKAQLMNWLKYSPRSWEVNRQVSLLLSQRPVRHFVPSTIKLLREADDPNKRLHYLFVLRNVKQGWTDELREEYFAGLRQLEDHIGGQGMPTFRRLIREEALASLPKDERPKYEAMLKRAEPAWLAEIPTEPREFVRKWKLTDFEGEFDLSDANRDLANGRKVFAAASCIRCHRFEGRGDVSGPDLTAVARRFAPRDLLASMLHPSKVISEKYASSTFELADGRVVSGTIAPGDYRSPELTVVPNLLEPETKITIPKIEIVERSLASVSPMPEGLLDTFAREDILDLVSYLSRGGERVSE